MKKTILYNLIAVMFFVVAAVALKTTVYADNCESNYGGGETCLVNKRFKIEKSVKVEGDDNWKDKVTLDKGDKDKTILFKVKITNMSDNTGDVTFDNMKMEDFLPKELHKVGGDGLTEEWDNFKPGQTKTFEIEAKIDSDEFDRKESFEKCVVNKAEVRWEGEFEGADTATVCFGHDKSGPKELPKTGGFPIEAATGFGLVSVGLVLKKFKR